MAVKTKTSVGKETASQTVARAKKMLGSSYDKNTKAPSSKRMDEIANQKFVSSSVRDAYNKSKTPVITPERVAPTEVADIPTYTAPAGDFGSILTQGNTELADPTIGLTQQNGQYVYDPTKSAGVNAAQEANQGNQAVLSQIADYLKPQEDQFSDAYSAIEKKSGLVNYQKDVNTYSSQLNNITSSRDAEMLKLEGQGRGQTQGFIGGEQARINREAAIQALPVQAQLAAAQGNLEMAQQRVNTLFQIKSQDISAQNTYKTNLANSVMQYANAAQQNILNAKLGDIQKQEQREQQAIADAKNIAMQAIEYGQSSLAARVMGLDPKSATYQQEVNSAMAQLRKPVTGGGSISAPDIKNIKRADGTEVSMQWNPTTGTWDEVGGGAINEAAGQKSLDQFNFLKKAITEAKDLVDATGPNMITQAVGNVFVGNTRVKQLQNKIDSLKTNLLTLNTDPNVKKFFGPQMSNKDTELLLSAGSTLNAYDSSEKANSQELVRYESLINRMEKAVREGLGQEQKTFQVNSNALPGSVYSRLQQPNIITTPDGLQIEIID